MRVLLKSNKSLELSGVAGIGIIGKLKLAALAMLMLFVWILLRNLCRARLAKELSIVLREYSWLKTMKCIGHWTYSGPCCNKPRLLFNCGGCGERSPGSISAIKLAGWNSNDVGTTVHVGQCLLWAMESERCHLKLESVSLFCFRFLCVYTFFESFSWDPETMNKIWVCSISFSLMRDCLGW